MTNDVEDIINVFINSYLSCFFLNKLNSSFISILFYFFLSFFFFLMWTIFEVFIEFVTILLLFYVLVFLATRHVGS